jgi:nicotinamidase-related amidase
MASSVDFQRDFLEDGGFGQIQGGNLEAVQASVKPAATVLKLARRAGLTVVHTREGHEPGLRDCPTCKVSPSSLQLEMVLTNLHPCSAHDKPTPQVQSTL